ncbi:MAG: FimV/HubP family polar landmark protein [Methylophagaceae bacterium]
MVIRTFASVAVISALGLLAPIQAYAFGLGKIETSSALNEPFKAEIAVTAIRGDEAGNLQVRLSSAEEFERAGIERHILLTKFKFEVLEKAGSATIIISSKDPVKEPFVDFLVTATTGQGLLIREYTVLLDPPKTVFATPKPVSKPSTVAKKPVQIPNKTSYQYDAPSSSTDYGSSYGPTNRTDTLWDIALKTKQGQSVSVHQQMMALVKQNPRAFNHQNINGLKAGYTLSIPTLETVKQLSKNKAISAVREQNASWKNRNRAPAPTAVVEETAMPMNTSEPAASDAAVTEPATAAPNAAIEGDNTARLKLVAPSDEALLEGGELSPMGSDQLANLSEQLTLAQETIEGQTQENIDIKSRMDVMEEQIQTLRRLISLKDADLARLQSSLEQDSQTDVDSNIDQMTEDTLALLEDQQQQLQDVQAGTNTDLEQVAEDNMAPLNDEMPLPSDQAADGQAEMNEVDQYFASVAEGAPEQEIMATNSMELDAAVDATEHEDISLSSIRSLDDAKIYASNMFDIDKGNMSSWSDKVKTFVAENKKQTMFGGLLALLLMWLFVRRSNRPDMTWDEAVEKLDGKEEAVAPVAAATEANTDNTDESEQMLVEEIDEELVSEASDMQQEVIEDITELEQAESDVLDTSTNDDMAMEEEISNLAFNIDDAETPIDENTLSDELPIIDNDEHDDLMSFESNVASTELDSDSVDSIEIDETLDESLSFDVSNDDSTSLSDEEITLDIAGDSSEQIGEEPDLELNIDNEAPLGIEGLESLSEEEMTAATAALTDVNELEFDLEDFDEVDEAETKLDLAAAYIDMGDSDGAKSILDEVVNEGNDEQKTRAQSMLTELS